MKDKKNCLNSVLLEGKVVSVPELMKASDGISININRGTFSIVSIRFNRMMDTVEKEETPVEIHVSGRLADACANNCKIGRIVRVVGRLKHYANTGLCIVAEHVEFRPIG